MESMLDRLLTSRQTDYYRAKCVVSARYLGIPATGQRLTVPKIPRSLQNNLVAVGVSFKSVARRCTQEPCILFMLKRKMPKGQLLRSERIPKTVGGVPTDVVGSQYIRVGTDPESGATGVSAEMLQSGARISVTGKLEHSGTLGGFMRDAAGARYLITNFHVLSPNLSKDGLGKPVFLHLPSGEPRRVGEVSHLVEWKRPGVNEVDLGAARIDPDVRVGYDIPEVGVVSGLAKVAATKVSKRGAESKVTTGGRIKGGNFNFSYRDGAKVYRFRNMHFVTPGKFAKRGDSGSLVVRSSDTSLMAVYMAESGSSRNIVFDASRVRNKGNLPELEWCFSDPGD